MSGELFLASGAVVCAPACQNQPPDSRPAHQTGSSASQIDLMFKLKEASSTVRVYVVGNRGAAQTDCIFEHSLQGRVKEIQLLLFQRFGHACGTNSGAEEAFIGINIAHAVQQLLVQKRGLDRGLPPAK